MKAVLLIEDGDKTQRIDLPECDYTTYTDSDEIYGHGRLDPIGRISTIATFNFTTSQPYVLRVADRGPFKALDDMADPSK